MMHVMSAPPSSATAGSPAAGRSGRSRDDGDFASILAAHSSPATGEQPAAVSGQAWALPAAPGDEGETSGDIAESSDEESSVLLAVVAPPPVSVEGTSPASAELAPDGEGGDAGRPPVESGEPEDGVTAASTTTATPTTLATASTTTTASATEAAPAAAPAPAPEPPARRTVSTELDQTRPTAGAPEAPTEEGGSAGLTRIAPDTARAGQPAASGTGWRAAPEGTQAAAAPKGPTDKADGAPRRQSTVEGPGARVVPRGQADMSAAVSVTSDAEGTAPVANRPAEGSQPLPSTVMDRVMRAVEALENAPPPKRVSFEVDGLRLTVSLRGDEVNVAVRGGGDQLGAGWQRDLDGALRGRGLGLADGQGSDTDRGDGRRHPDDRPPRRSAERGPVSRQTSGPDGDTSTNLHL